MREFTITSLEDLIEVIFQAWGNEPGCLWFRGHRDMKWNLHQTVWRDYTVNSLSKRLSLQTPLPGIFQLPYILFQSSTIHLLEEERDNAIDHYQRPVHQ